MKELKFRAFHKPSNKMFDVGMIDFLANELIGIEDLGNGFSMGHFNKQIKDCELMQFTGLKDVDGKDIFEGDIIVIPNIYPFYHENKLNYVGVVEFIYSQWEYVLKCVNPKKRGISNGINNILNDAGYEENTLTHYKILGNIHQNSELLERK